jgi:murein DD-endopeptidase MepM/ murein hydrolase activator NlpD
MAPPKQQTISSPLVSALNNIVSINRSSSTMKSTQQSFQGFLKFMDVEIKNIETIPLPKKKDVKKLSNLNVAATFGSAGSLLSSLANGALDAAGFVGDFFSGRKKGGVKPNPKAGGAIPKGKGIKLGGFKALGVANALFAGLDFATGLAEGESVGKAAAGAGGALAGSLIGGAIGQALIPVPGLGFVVGSMAGNFLGGFLGDRAHEAVTGEGDKSLEQKTRKRLKAKEQEQRSKAASLTTLTLPQVLDKFEGVVYKFERSIQNISAISEGENTPFEFDQGETEEDKVDYRPEGSEEFTPTGSGDEVFPLVGGRPTLTPGAGTFTASRDGGKRQHNGQDIGVDPNTPVVASRSGKVLDAYSNGYGAVGGAVIVRYDNGQQGLYGHVTPNVKTGDKVQAGQKIAKVTPDGQNTHLHYMRKDTRGKYIDPAPILKQSKSGVPVIKPEKQESKKDLEKQSTFGTDSGDSMVSKKDQMIPKATPKEELSKMSTDQLKSQLDPTVTAASNPAVFQAAQQARMRGQESGLSGESLEREVMIASIRAKEEAQVQAISQQQVTSQQLEQYPSYNQSQSTTTIIPMMMSSGGSQQRPVVISGGGGGGETIVMPSAPMGAVLNSLLSSMLLTNLSGT